MTTQQNLESIFPGLQLCPWEITSDPDTNYNCIAWAVKTTAKPWWPNDFGYWPAGVPRVETVEAFIAAFATKGFVPCLGGAVEPGFEKIALFTKNGLPTNAARQLHDGQWTSKLGQQHDITHAACDAVAGEIYGSVTMYLIRSIPPDSD